MNENMQQVLKQCIESYIRKTEHNRRLADLSQDWKARLEGIVNSIKTYDLTETDIDLIGIIEDEITLASYNPQERLKVETLNQLIFIITGSYSDEFYRYASRLLQ